MGFYRSRPVMPGVDWIAVHIAPRDLARSFLSKTAINPDCLCIVTAMTKALQIGGVEVWATLAARLDVIDVGGFPAALGSFTDRVGQQFSPACSSPVRG